jgi:hypothetical protein
MSFFSKKNRQKFYQWDNFSDQPYPIRDKKYKRFIRLLVLPASVKMLLISLVVFPIILSFSRSVKKNRLPVQTKEMIGLCVNIDKEPDLSVQLVDDVGVKKLSIRLPLSDISNIDKYVSFVKQFPSCDVLIVVLQDRNHIDDKSLSRESFNIIFSKFSQICVKYQIGNAINRTKWGFVSIDEYFRFFSIAQRLRDEKFPGYVLLGSAVIDFEIYAIIRSMWHLRLIRYDAISSLLYVDRRGAPENKQLSFSLTDKISFIKSCAALSCKTSDRIFITEANWPIEFTQPYAPALDDVWVSEACYANYMLRYLLLAIASGQVETVYWHQLIAPGYGLVDNRDNKIVKRDAYYFFKTFYQLFCDVLVTETERIGSVFIVKAKDNSGKGLWAIWSMKGHEDFYLPPNMDLLNAFGEKTEVASGDGPIQIKVSERVSYFVQK